MNEPQDASVAYDDQPIYVKPPLQLTAYVFCTATLLAVFGYWVMNGHQLALGKTLWFYSLLGAVYWFSAQRNKALFGLGLLFATLLSFRASEVLNVINSWAVILVLFYMAAQPTLLALRNSSLIAFLANIRIFSWIAAPILFVFSDVNWSALRENKGRMSWLPAVFRILVIGIPVLFVFLMLFMSADALYAKMVSDIASHLFDISWNLETGVQVGFYGFLSLAFIRMTAFGSRWHQSDLPVPSVLRFGLIEVIVLYGLLIALFVSFIVVQFEYFFGGKDIINTVKNLTYSEYARSGFFELVLVVVLLQMTLLVGFWICRRAEPKVEYAFRILGLCLIALSSVVFYSALMRMALYVETYGLTELRFYATAFMLWLIVSMLVFAAHVWVRNSDWFPSVYAGSFVAFLVLLNVVNPDGWIAKRNVSLDIPVTYRDYEYTTQLSSDAFPQMSKVFDQLTVSEQTSILNAKKVIITDNANAGWRAWNVSRWRASNLFQSNSE
ncbi:DUF4153 domain-containing protein [Reinekea sp. G2M2-21]|uniref:DUF4153 domain-containing protein n=1 Tax=Reinekea sp. G2M2-21 TaxID=2788942 RepID=UPI0018ABA353|nr:DUF4173 domain-containing protein [Reinekea sp. G2M2-21]